MSNANSKYQKSCIVPERPCHYDIGTLNHWHKLLKWVRRDSRKDTTWAGALGISGWWRTLVLHWRKIEDRYLVNHLGSKGKEKNWQNSRREHRCSLQASLYFSLPGACAPTLQHGPQEDLLSAVKWRYRKPIRIAPMMGTIQYPQQLLHELLPEGSFLPSLGLRSLGWTSPM